MQIMQVSNHFIILYVPFTIFLYLNFQGAGPVVAKRILF